ncbi:TPA: AzlD domain-containing protein [Streptococcus pneumoniae]
MENFYKICLRLDCQSFYDGQNQQTFFSALILSSVVTGKVGSLPQIKWLDFLAVFPTAWVAFRYRNLVGTVLFGVVLIAVLRLVF